MRLRSLIPSTVALVAAASVSLAVVPTPAVAVTNGIGISAKTKSVLKGETARVTGKVIGARAGTLVTIQQRQGGSGKDWGSGRQVKTDSKGKFVLDRKIKGKFTRDYRACTGPAGNRKCSLRARVEVLPRTKGITLTRAPQAVTAGAQITVDGVADVALAGRSVTLEQYQARRVRWLPVASAAVRPDLTFALTGNPQVPGKAQQFRVTSPAFSGRPTSVSSEVTAAIGGYYSLTAYSPVAGGFDRGPATYSPLAGTGRAYPVGSVLAPSQANPNDMSGTVNLAGSCDRLLAGVFLDGTRPGSADTDRVNAVVASVGAGGAVTEEYRRNNVQRGDPLNPFDVDITGAQTLTLRQTMSDVAGSTNAPLWYGDPIVSCAL